MTETSQGDFGMRGKCMSASVILFGISAIPMMATTIPTGDVAVAVGNSSVSVFTPTGTLVETLNDGSGTPYTTGMVFDGSGNLYVTNFGTGTVSQFNANGGLVNSAFITASNTPESILQTGSGNFLVGGPGANTVSSAGGSPAVTYTVQGGNGTGGTDWTDLAADQHTLLYDGEGTEILSYNLATNT